MADMTTLGKIIIQRLDRLEDKMDLSREEIAVLKIKAGLWGGVAGMIPVIVVLLLKAL